MNRLLLRLLPLFAFAALTTAHAQFTLVETGGTFRTDAVNLAAASNGGIAIGQDELDYGIHYISAINDGTYGNANSWIGYSDYTPSSWVGAIFAAPATVASFAFGRDNNGIQTGDRIANAPYTFEYTTDSVSDQAGANSATWLNLGALNYALSPPASPWLRHVYDLNIPLTGVTAFRIVTNSGINAGNAIDELEVYATSAIPEPSTYAMVAGLGALGFVAWRRRRLAP